MSTTILATKLYLPPPRPNLVRRPRLIERLNEGLPRKLTLVSAPAGFGKTTLLSEWLAACPRPVAWLSLDVGECDPTRFLTYLVAAMQTVAATVGHWVLDALQSPQPPSTEALLTALLNDLSAFPDPFVLVLDDYHVIDAQPVDQALTFLLEHLSPQLHLVLATREDPRLPLARFRAQDHLSELRAADLRFTLAEAAAFLTEAMGLRLSAADIANLETRTEGWIAGLQLAALSLQGQQDASSFISSFTGSHRFVLDFLVNEVLQQQPERVQTFLLRTSILERLCGPLCDAVLLDSAGSGQATLDYLDHANLFLVPLDHERRWYRFHHLFAQLLRQRLQQSTTSAGEGTNVAAELHIRASAWYELQGLALEAFQHAAAAQDVERAVRLIDRKRIPLQDRATVRAILDWLESLPKPVLYARPALLARQASLMLVNGQTTGVAEKLQTAEAALQGAEPSDKTRDVVGEIAAARATLAQDQNEAETIITQAHRALEYLHPTNLSFRTTAYWTLGFAYFRQGDRAAARQAYTDAIALSQTSGNIFTTILASIGLGTVEEAENHLHMAAKTYRHVLQLAGDQPLPLVCEAYLGLARICYEWNDLPAAEQHGQESLHLARQYERGIDQLPRCELFLARLKLAQGDTATAAALLAQAEPGARRRNVGSHLREITAVRVLTLLRQGNLAAAAHLARAQDIPLSQARVHLAQGDPSAALMVLLPWRQRVEAMGWVDARLQVLVVQALALQALGDQEPAEQVLLEALVAAEPEGFIRLFVDEGVPMAELVSRAAAHGLLPDYLERVLAVFEEEAHRRDGRSYPPSPAQSLLEPLSRREIEVLQLMAQGRSNQEIARQLFLALSTVKGHNLKIFGKLQVQRRTEAVARARQLGLL